jgi:hypothetical protein
VTITRIRLMYPTVVALVVLAVTGCGGQGGGGKSTQEHNNRVVSQAQQEEMNRSDIHAKLEQKLGLHTDSFSASRCSTHGRGHVRLMSSSMREVAAPSSLLMAAMKST